MKTHAQIAKEAIGFVSKPMTKEDWERVKRIELARRKRREARSGR